ncbi:MAG: nitroreductase family deazaflavin-dependent oxidoreductase [Deltaproteobacteria bacterium]|nr:nitroreductase family deazaflavin-dependent oxidoreductase [Deltaproteobacteria bacterium]
MNRFVVALTTSSGFAWWVRNVASRLDPILFRASNGRLTSFGPTAAPMLTVTTIGRKSGRPHPVTLACVEYENDHLIVASAMGQERHPAWRYNLEAHPEVGVQATGGRFTARARLLSDAEKAAVWPAIVRGIPQIAVYERRTDRNIRVFRLSRLG